ncbi:MAG: DUF4360 domain-containing protein [Gammaproteobacteria bacterium]|nr:DUF4360 domain-containing protein [Gammaproteobacteria bacterium]
MFKKIFLGICIFIYSGFAIGKTLIINGEEITIGPISVNGIGCPNGTVTATATADNKNVAILFSAYSAITNAEAPVATTNCNIAIPLSVDPGLSVGILDIDWRGSVFAAPGAFINFHREFFFSGDVGPFKDTNWSSSGFENFLLNDRPPFASYSSCDGGALIARADTSALVIGADSLFSLRAADVGAQLLLSINVRPCEV